MKTGRIILVTLSLTTLFLTGCIKEALLLDKLRGEWELDDSEYLVTTNADVTFIDFYSKPWTGTVTVNGVEQDCSNNHIISFWRTRLYINQDISLYFAGPLAALGYKDKMYESSINWDIIKTGEINKELTFNTADNNIVNIKFDLKAPETTLQKGVEYKMDDSRWMKDHPVTELEFLSPSRITGTLCFGDMLDKFNGRWSAASSGITLKMESDVFSEKITQKHNYFCNSQELTLFKNIDYYKIESQGAIPLDKIATVKQVIHYKRKN